MNTYKKIVLLTFLCFGMLLASCINRSDETEETMSAAIAAAETAPAVEEESTSSNGKYDYTSPYVNNYAVVHVNKKQGVIDRKGREIAPPVYDAVWYFSEGMCIVQQGEKYGFIDTSGKEVIPLVYDFAVDFTDDLASVRKDDKWGYIDKNGKEIVPFIYEMAWAFSGHLGCVKKNGKWGFINKKGEVVIPFRFDYVHRKFDMGEAQVEKDGKKFRIDTKGNKTGKK